MKIRKEEFLRSLLAVGVGATAGCTTVPAERGVTVEPAPTTGAEVAPKPEEVEEEPIGVEMEEEAPPPEPEAPPPVEEEVGPTPE